MNISIVKNGKTATVALDGRLDTNTAPGLDSELSALGGEISEMVFHLAHLAYISSAGLRVLLKYQKKMNAAGGKMILKNPNEFVTEIFDATGFSDILTIE